MSVAFLTFACCLWMLVAVTASHEGSCPPEPPSERRPGRREPVLPALAVARVPVRAARSGRRR